MPGSGQDPVGAGPGPVEELVEGRRMLPFVDGQAHAHVGARPPGDDGFLDAGDGRSGVAPPR